MEPLVSLLKSLAHTAVWVVVPVLLYWGAIEEEKQSIVPVPVHDNPGQIMETAGDRCWATPAEHPAELAGEDPGSAVLGGHGEVTRPGLVHKAAEQAYYGVDHGLRIYGFCR